MCIYIYIYVILCRMVLKAERTQLLRRALRRSCASARLRIGLRLCAAPPSVSRRWLGLEVCGLRLEALSTQPDFDPSQLAR